MFITKMHKNRIIYLVLLLFFLIFQLKLSYSIPPDLVITAKKIIDDQVSETNGEPFMNFGMVTNLGIIRYLTPYQYFEVSFQHESAFSEWGIQIYTDNMGYIGMGLRGGLINISKDHCVPLFWRVFNTNTKAPLDMVITNSENWARIIDKNNSNWTNQSQSISLIYSNHLAPFPFYADRSLPDDTITNADIYLYLGSFIDGSTPASSLGVEFSTTLYFDLYHLSVAPTILSITPHNGYVDSSVDVYIQGWNFIKGATPSKVYLQKQGEVSIQATNTIVTNENEIYCSFNLNNRTPGFWNVIVTNAGNPSLGILLNGFEIRSLDPVILSIDPKKGRNNTILYDMSIKGYNFMPNRDIRLQKEGEADIVAFDVRLLSSSNILCNFNLKEVIQPGRWDLKITRSDGRIGLAKEVFMIYGHTMKGDVFYPVNNSFNPHKNEFVYFKWSMTKNAYVHLKIYNLKGELIKTLIDNINYSPGAYQLEWNGKNNYNRECSSGVYFVQFITDTLKETKKILIIK